MTAMNAFVPLFQTALWVILIVAVLIAGRKQWSGILGGIRDRIDRGDPVRFGIGSLSAEFDRDSQGAVRIAPGDDPGSGGNPAQLDDPLEVKRSQIGKEQRGVQLVHVATPSAESGQRYDLFVYLTGWRRSEYGQPENLSDVKDAEFHVGPKFTPSTVLVKNNNQGKIGFTTSAHGPVICVCRVTFTDGETAVLQRYLDFESAELAERAARGHN